MNTPTMTSTKWWPGEMGRYANHALIYARLKIKSKDYGVMPFIVQIRNMDTHKHMQGVECGNLGPKLGMINKDNGWLTLKDVRIPRDQMLQRFMKVDRDGEVSVQGDLKILYSTMMATRMYIVTTAREFLAKGLTIGLRYSVCRRQFKNISGS